MLNRDEALLLVVDVQERLLPHIHDGDQALERIVKLVRGVKALGVPALVTEQYPKGLGSTVGPLRVLFDPFEPIEKIAFSCMGEGEVRRRLSESGRRQVLLCGIEAHVCVYQTARDLLDAGYGVHLVVDSVSSRSQRDRKVAIRAVERAGALLTTTEMSLFEMLGEAGSDDFRAISRIVK